MSAATGWSRAGISTAMTLDFLIMGVGGFGWGALSDRFGPRIVVLAGAVLLGAGLVARQPRDEPLTFQLGYGVLVGLAAGAFFAPMIAAVTGWFDTQRGTRGLAGLGRHGHGADDHLAVRELADRRSTTGAPRSSAIGDRRLGAADPGGAVRAPRARPRRLAADAPADAIGHDAGPGAALAAVPRCSRSPSSSAARRTPGRSSTW